MGQGWFMRGTLLLLLAVVLGLPFILRPWAQREDAPAGAVVGRLVIVSPHNEQIRYEFARGYNAWRAARGLGPVELDWRAWGGTGDLMKQVVAQFTKSAEDGREDQGIGYDLFFGGGDYEHNKLAAGISVKRGGADTIISLTVPLELPAELRAQAFPQPTIGSVRLYHPQWRWVGAALSSFGIVYNRDLLAARGIPEPTTWADLADPRYRTLTALSDPSHSSSIKVTYNTILQRLGWVEGWKTLRRTYANARYFTASAGKVPVDVSAGEAAAGMCIDFYGRFQAGAVMPDHAGPARVGYVDPAGLTAITPDPIAILRGAPHAELALDFVTFVLSTQGQGLWQRRVGELDGPRRYELRRLPVRKDMYEPAEMSRWVDRVDAFALAAPMPPGTPNYFDLVAPVSHALALDVHDDLKEAWAALNRDPKHPRRAEMEALFDWLPEELRDASAAGATLKSWKDRPDVVTADSRRWMLQARDNYRRIVRLANSK